MKQIAIFCLVLQIILSGIYCATFFWLGYSETLAAIYATNPLWFLGCGMILFFVLLAQMIRSLMRTRYRLWMKTAIIGFFAFFLIPLGLRPAHGLLLAWGIKHRIMQDYSLDDLRRFARDINDALQDKDYDHGYYCYKGSFMFLPIEQQPVYDQFRQKYPFLKWNGDGSPGPSVYHHGDALSVYWAGRYVEWGFSVGLDGGDNVPPDGVYYVRASDDIYFYME